MEGEERQVKGRGGWGDPMAAFQHVNNQLRRRKSAYRMLQGKQKLNLF